MLGRILGFLPLPAPLTLALIGLTVLYVIVAEVAKKHYCARLVNAQFLGISKA